MGDVSEIQQAKAWIYTVLAANSDIAAVVGTRIYSDYVPEPPANRIFPYLLYEFIAGTDVDALGTNRLLTKPLFQVRVVTEGRPSAAARKVDKRIDDVLRMAVYQASGEFYFTARREQPIDRPELDAATGKHYHNLGGLFRLFVGGNPHLIDPAVLDSARAWYEADRISGFSSGSPLATWTDASIRGNSATQATSGNRPTMQTFHGQPTVAFDGSNDFMDIPSGVSQQVYNTTVFLVVHPVNRYVASAKVPLELKPQRVAVLPTVAEYYHWNGSGTVTYAGVSATTRAFLQPNYAGKIGGADKFAPTVLMFQDTASTSLLRMNGLDYTAAVRADAAIVGGAVGNFNGFSNYNGNLHVVGVFENMSATYRDAVYMSLMAKYSYTYTTQNLIVTMGDSITQGIFATTQLDEWPSQLISLLHTDGKGYQIYNDAYVGLRVQDVVNRFAVYITPKYNAARSKNIAVLFVGSNNIAGGVSAATTYSELTSAIDSLQATGWTVYVVTMLPRTDVITTEETARLDYNSAIIGNAAGAEFVINLGTVTDLQNPANATYYPDGIHLSNAGGALVMQAVHDVGGF